MSIWEERDFIADVAAGLAVVTFFLTVLCYIFWSMMYSYKAMVELVIYANYMMIFILIYLFKVRKH